MVDYVRILKEAVQPSPEIKLSENARAGVYRRCLDALDRHLARANPPVPPEAMDAERRKLLAATEFIETLMSHPQERA